MRPRAGRSSHADAASEAHWPGPTGDDSGRMERAQPTGAGARCSRPVRSTPPFCHSMARPVRWGALAAETPPAEGSPTRASARGVRGIPHQRRDVLRHRAVHHCCPRWPGRDSWVRATRYLIRRQWGTKSSRGACQREFRCQTETCLSQCVSSRRPLKAPPTGHEKASGERLIGRRPVSASFGKLTAKRRGIGRSAAESGEPERRRAERRGPLQPGRRQKSVDSSRVTVKFPKLGRLEGR